MKLIMRRIVSTKDTLFGMPRIDGRRISVYNIVSSLWNDKNISEYCNSFELTEEEVLFALKYCKELNCQKNDVIQFCEGCILNTINDKIKSELNLKKVNENLFEDEESNFYINNSQQEIENEEFGYMGWLRAGILYNDFVHPSSTKSSK